MCYITTIPLLINWINHVEKIIRQYPQTRTHWYKTTITVITRREVSFTSALNTEQLTTIACTHVSHLKSEYNKGRGNSTKMP